MDVRGFFVLLRIKAEILTRIGTEKKNFRKISKISFSEYVFSKNNRFCNRGVV